MVFPWVINWKRHKVEKAPQNQVPKEGEIWTYNGKFCKIICVANELGGDGYKDDIVVYSKCNEMGIYMSIRDDKDNITRQPFYQSVNIFINVWKKYKTVNYG